MAEKEYIERDSLICQIASKQNRLRSCDDHVWEMNKKHFRGLAWARRLALDAPAADVVEVVHADGSRMKTRKDIRVIRNVQHAKVSSENMIRTYASQGRTAFSTVPTAERRWTVRPTIMSVTKGGERE